MVRPLEEDDPELGKRLADYCRLASENKCRRIDEVGINESALPGRNDPCFCGSGRKFKKCCGN